MTRDYARRSAPARKKPASKRARTSASSGRSSKRATAPARTSWSAPSFSAGVVFGAALVLLASYAPSAFEDTVVAVRQQVEQPEEEIQFIFPEILENDTVEADTSVYPALFPNEDPNAPQSRYMIQAISLRSAETAASLSAELNSAGINARFERVDLSQGTWYRIMVGPFSSRLEANRTMTELRRRNMSPRLSKLG